MVFPDLDKIYTIVIHPLYFILSFAFSFFVDKIGIVLLKMSFQKSLVLGFRGFYRAIDS